MHRISGPPSVRGACIPDLQVETEAQAGLNGSCAVNPELDSDRLGPSVLAPLLTTSQRVGPLRSGPRVSSPKWWQNCMPQSANPAVPKVLWAIRSKKGPSPRSTSNPLAAP